MTTKSKMQCTTKPVFEGDELGLDDRVLVAVAIDEELLEVVAIVDSVDDSINFEFDTLG